MRAVTPQESEPKVPPSTGGLLEAWATTGPLAESPLEFTVNPTTELVVVLEWLQEIPHVKRYPT